MKEPKNISELNIKELHHLVLRHGFLILKPVWYDGNPDIQIEVPTPKQRACVQY